MEYVYKYVTSKTNKARYIGITNNLKQRVLEHLSEPRFSNEIYDVFFIKCETRNDAETLEGHFISLYGTAKGKGLNRGKHNWGLSSFVPDNLEWEFYKQEDMTLNEVNRVENKKLEIKLSKKVLEKQRELERLEKRINEIKKEAIT